MNLTILIDLTIEMLHTKLKMATIMELWYKWYTAFHWHWTNSISDFFLSYKLSLKCMTKKKLTIDAASSNLSSATLPSDIRKIRGFFNSHLKDGSIWKKHTDLFCEVDHLLMNVNLMWVLNFLMPPFCVRSWEYKI